MATSTTSGRIKVKLTKTLAIDPGADQGWAIFNKGKLEKCGLGLPEDEDFKGIKAAIIEMPMIYPRSKAKPNDIITLAFRAGKTAGLLQVVLGVQVETVTPTTWKGQVPKEIHHARINKALSVPELLILHTLTEGVPKTKAHNMIDAVGLGLYAVDRKV